MPQRPASHSNSSQGLNASGPLTNSFHSTQLKSLHWLSAYNISARTIQKTAFQRFLYCWVTQLSQGLRRERRFQVSPFVHIRNMFPSNGRCLQSRYLATGLHATILSRYLSGGSGMDYEERQSGKPIFCPRFERRTCWIWMYSVTVTRTRCMPRVSRFRSAGGGGGGVGILELLEILFRYVSASGQRNPPSTCRDVDGYKLLGQIVPPSWAGYLDMLVSVYQTTRAHDPEGH
jgi:hypothetical protein